MPERPTDDAARMAFWERIHDGKPADGVSWWQSVPHLSLDLVDRAGLSRDAGVIDVGAGSSTLVDHLVERGFSDLTALDLSATALQKIRERLGAAGRDVVLEVADVLELAPDRRYTLWHDRAVFHFLTEPHERDDYRASLARALEPDGYAVIATFGPDGPETCSGLPIMRYSHGQLAAEFPGFEVIAEGGEDHQTPWGTIQQFTALLLRRNA